MSKLFRQEPAPRQPLPPVSQDSIDKSIDERVEAEVQRRLRERTDADVKYLQERLDRLESQVSSVTAPPPVSVAASPARSTHPAAYLVLGALSGILGVMGAEQYLNAPDLSAQAPVMVAAAEPLPAAPPPPAPLVELLPVPAPVIAQADAPLAGPYLTILSQAPVSAPKQAPEEPPSALAEPVVGPVAAAEAPVEAAALPIEQAAPVAAAPTSETAYEAAREPGTSSPGSTELAPPPPEPTNPAPPTYREVIPEGGQISL